MSNLPKNQSTLCLILNIIGLVISCLSPTAIIGIVMSIEANKSYLSGNFKAYSEKIKFSKIMAIANCFYIILMVAIFALIFICTQEFYNQLPYM